MHAGEWNAVADAGARCESAAATEWVHFTTLDGHIYLTRSGPAAAIHRVHTRDQALTEYGERVK